MLVKKIVFPALTVALVCAGFISLTATRAESSSIFKPTSTTHAQQIFNDGDTDDDASGTNVYDDSSARETSTHASFFQLAQDSDEQPFVLFYNWDMPTDTLSNPVLYADYDFARQDANDAFLLSYSTSGDPFCHGDYDQANGWSRTWRNAATIEYTGQRVELAHILTTEDVETLDEFCVKIEPLIVGDEDGDAGDFTDANRLDMYDLRIESFDETDLGITLSIEDSNVHPGDTVTIEHTIYNTSDVDVENISVAFDPSSALAETESTNDTYYLEAGDSYTVEKSYTVQDGFLGIDAYRSSVTSYNPDSDSANNEDSLILTITLEEETEEPEEEIYDLPTPEPCALDCDGFAYYVYIVNPDGSTRYTGGDYSTTTRHDDRNFTINFEDSGSDFDYNDVLITVDVRDCDTYRVSVAEVNAGWHHQIYGALYYHDELLLNELIWDDSHDAVGQEHWITPLNHTTCTN